MDYLYELLDSEDLFRIPKDIKNRFAKLTLSKRKEIRKSISQNRSDVDKILARNIIEELLTDDSSEGEAETINRIFLSGSMTNMEKTDTIECTNTEKLKDTVIIPLDTENLKKLVSNDSDITHCSIYENNNDGRPLEKSNSFIDMERLQVTENIVLTNSENLFTTQKSEEISPNKIVDTLSQKINNLAINSPEKCITISSNDTVENIQIISTDSQRKSEIYNKNIKIETVINKSILTISSANSTPARKLFDYDDDLSSSGEEDIIVIEDSEEESIKEYEIHVSDLRKSGQTNLCSTLSNTRADRIEAFLHDLDQISQSDTNIPKNTKKKCAQRKDIEPFTSDDTSPNESVEIPETSTEHENEIYFDEVNNYANSLPNESVEITETSSENGNVMSDKLMKSSNEPLIDQESPTIEDDSPLIQTEKKSTKVSPTPSPTNDDPSDSSDSEQEISISAKINIKIQFSQPKIILTNRDSYKSSHDESLKSSNESRNEKSKQSTSSTRESEHFQENQKLGINKNFPKIEKISTLDNTSLDDVDDKAKEILTKLYGNTWQTPEIIKKLDRKTNSPAPVVKKSSSTKKNQAVNKNLSGNRNSPTVGGCERTVNDTTVADFSMFHKNIRHDLESTRLKSPVKPKTPVKNSNIPQTERKPRTKKYVDSRCQSVKTKTERLIKRTNYREVKSSSDCSDDDVTYSKGCSVSSDEFFEKPTRKPRKDQNELIYMDLSTNVVKIVDKTVCKTPVMRSDSNEKLENVLKSCTFDGKKKIPATSKNTLTKRKLFTPQFGNEDDNPIYNSPIIRKELDLSDEVQLRVPLPGIFAPPIINKQLETVKTGTPIFKMPTPTKATPKTIKNKEKMKENTPPKTPTSLRKIKKALADEFLDDDQRKTYGFLQSLDVSIPKVLCHPNALIYREKFRQTKDELTETLSKLFNEKVFENKLEVSIIWNKKLQNTAGRCCNRKKGNIRSCTVELSEKVLTSADRLRCTLIHELCHAATWIFSGENGHGATWKSWAKKANKVFPELPVIGVCHEYDIEYKYTYKCTVCAAKSNAHSRSKKVENIRCSYCHGAIEIFLNKKNKDGIIVATPVKGATGFAKFVKEKYKVFKRPNVTHAEVMKMLSTEFAGLSVEEKNKF